MKPSAAQHLEPGATPSFWFQWNPCTAMRLRAQGLRGARPSGQLAQQHAGGLVQLGQHPCFQELWCRASALHPAALPRRHRHRGTQWRRCENPASPLVSRRCAARTREATVGVSRFETLLRASASLFDTQASPTCWMRCAGPWAAHPPCCASRRCASWCARAWRLR